MGGSYTPYHCVRCAKRDPGDVALNGGLLQNHFRGVCRVQNPTCSHRAWRHYTFDHFARFAFSSCSSPVVPGAASEERIKERTTAEGSGKESHCLLASRDAEDRVGGSAEVGPDLL